VKSILLPFYLFWYGICIFRARLIGYKESKFIIQSKGGCTMKTKLPIIAIVAILVSACTTGTHLAKSYEDDIYFSPKDVSPVAVAESKTPAKEKSVQQKKSETENQQVIISEMNQNTDGSNVVTNSVYQSGTNNSGQTGYDMNDQELIGSDTTVYYNDDDVKYVINNYYDDNDMSYADQFNRFYGPYYSPYYSPYYYDDYYYGGYWGYPSWGFSVGFGWGYPYYGWGYPYYGWGYPYYGYGCGYPYYGYGGCYPGGGYYYDDVQVSQRRTTNMNAAGNGINGNSSNTGRQSLNSMNSSIQSGVQNATATNPNKWDQNGHTRGTTIDAAANSKNATVVNDRRGNTNSVNSSAGAQVQNRTDSRAQMTRPASNSSVNARRSYAPSTTGSTYSQSRTVRQIQNYTPSYNKPRIVNQSNYNNSYARPRTSNGNVLERAAVKSANSGNSGSSYSQPRSSSSMRQTYRSSSSYSSGSSSSSGRSSSNYSPSSSPSYSAPSRSSSGSSYSGGSNSGGGGGYSGGSSGGSSGGGGGGSGHRR
jgi:hypothetical protein